MKNRRIVLTLLGIVIIAAQMSCCEARTYTTVGLSNCDSWLQSRDAEISGKVGISRLSDKSWVAGFITGVNQERTSSDLMTGLDLQTVMDWVDRYCEMNHADDVQAAVNALFKKLRAQH